MPTILRPVRRDPVLAVATGAINGVNTAYSIPAFRSIVSVALDGALQAPTFFTVVSATLGTFTVTTAPDPLDGIGQVRVLYVPR